VVATVSGRLDALVFIVGMGLGSLLFAELFPVLEGFYRSGDMGAVRLSDVLPLHSGRVALLAVLMALAAYGVAERVERVFGDPGTLPDIPLRAKISAAVLVLILAVGLAVINPDAKVHEPPEPVQGADDTWKPTPFGDQGDADEVIIIDDEGC
jgi:hypothetical protein